MISLGKQFFNIVFTILQVDLQSFLFFFVIIRPVIIFKNSKFIAIYCLCSNLANDSSNS